MAVQSAGGAAFPETLFDQSTFTPLFATEGGPVCAGFGFVSGQGAYAVWQNGKPLGAADIDIHVKTLELAAKTGSPVVSLYDAKGALLEEGALALSAAARLSAVSARLSGVVPQIAVVTGVCGASNALAAAGADFLVMSEDAQFFLTPPFLSAANGDKLPGAGGAEAAVQAGLAAKVAENAEEAVRFAARLLALLPQNNLAAPASFDHSPASAALNPAVANAEAAVAALADEGSANELFAGFGKGARVYLATLSGAVVGLVATEGEKVPLCHKDSAKIARFVRFCDAFSIPVVTVLNTAGFAQSASEDVAGNLREAARLAGTYADATTATVAVVCGKAVGAAYTALGGADLTIAVEGCVLAAAEPTAVASVLYHEEIESSGKNIETETAARAKAWAAEEAGAPAALRAGLADFTATGASLRGTVAAALDILATKRTQRLPKKHGNMPL